MKCNKETEVFSRVVGFHRPIKHWNKGKKAEFEDRKAFNAPQVNPTNVVAKGPAPVKEES